MIWGLEGRHLWIPPGLALSADASYLAPPGLFAESAVEWYSLDTDDLIELSPLAVNPGGDFSLSSDFGAKVKRVALHATVDSTSGGPKSFTVTITGGDVVASFTYTYTADDTDAPRFEVTIDYETQEIRTGETFFSEDDDDYVTVGDAPWGGTITAHSFTPADTLPDATDSDFDFATSGSAAAEFVFSESATPQMQVWTGVPSSSLIALNYRKDDNGDSVWPRYNLKNIGGLHGLADSGDRRDKRVGARGEIPRRSYRGGKTVSYGGLTQARNRADLRDSEAALREAFDDQSDEGLMVVTPHPLYDDSGEYRYFNARALSCDIDDVIATSVHRASRGHESSFAISLRNKDGLYYDQDGNAHK